MKDQIDEDEMDALKANIAYLRDDIAALNAGLKNPSGTKDGHSHTENEKEAGAPSGPNNEDKGSHLWTDFQHTLGEALVQGEKVILNLKDEISRHPLAGSIAAFGLGFIIAKLWYNERFK